MIGRKHKKALSAQDLYRARKQQEEAERQAYLPPGLVNHGNTCFMNSVLQGLIATPLLSDSVRFLLPEARFRVNPQRSPQLTNGHGRAGDREQAWVDGMPLGDIFVGLMEKAWKFQDERARVSISPKEILTKLGAKYDQYLDFRQQDAHELLRHLLDAMRMEELDVIKKRQPLPPRARHRKAHSHITVQTNGKRGAESPDQTPHQLPVPEEERLVSFVDMIFGGQLASVLVCETCKKVSYTYEDFNDLSLSIKPEDEKAHKMNRLKNLAQKWKKRTGVGSWSWDSETPVRPRSVPGSPILKPVNDDRLMENPQASDLERRSMDGVSEGTSVMGTETPLKNENHTIMLPSAPESVKAEAQLEGSEQSQSKKDNVEHVTWDDHLRDHKAHYDRSDDKDDSWARIGRKLSVGRKPDGLRSRDKGKDEKPERKDKRRSKMEFWLGEPIDLKLPVRSVSASPRSDSGAMPKQSPKLPHTPARMITPATSRPGTPGISSTNAILPQTNQQSAPPLVRGRTHRAPKPSREEAAYLRRMLADVPSNPVHPLSALLGPSSTTSVDHIGNVSIWSKFGGVNSIEDCLRMFTAVEVLDGENRVGCHRCWKIENGLYGEKNEAGEKACVVCDDDSSEGSGNEKETKAPIVAPTLSQIPSNALTSSSPAITSSSSVLSPSPSLLDLNEGVSIRSVPTTLPSSSTEVESPKLAIPDNDPSESTVSLPDIITVDTVGTYRGRPIPLISTTGPDSAIPIDVEAASPQHQMVDLPERIEDVDTPLAPQTARPDSTPLASPSKDSLLLPNSRPRHGRTVSSENHGEISEQSAEESEDDLDSDTTSLSDSVLSVNSTNQAQASEPTLTTAHTLPEEKTVPHTAPLEGPRRIPRSKQVVLRRSFKRYLISIPPPVLVIHLKRFQQVGKQTYQFFGNFKKIDDFISFPEYFDLKPFLVPHREEFGLKRHRSSRTGQEKRETKANEICMYRLYAVIVHIGNMLGGHYVAYTALPDDKSLPPKQDSTYSSPDTESIQSNSQSLTVPQPTRPEASRTASFESTAQVKGKHNRLTRQWCYISDTVVRLTTLEEVLKAKAYICMYERL